MIELKKAFPISNGMQDGCGCDINTWDGDCRYVDDGDCGCDD